MIKYKVIFDGEEEEEIFDTYEQAQQHALYLCSCTREGAEMLSMSNPGDYDEDEWVNPEYKIVEIEEK